MRITLNIIFEELKIINLEGYASELEVIVTITQLKSLYRQIGRGLVEFEKDQQY